MSVILDALLADTQSLVEPSVLWWWNDTPSLAEIDARVQAYDDAGLRALYIHPMPQSFRPNDFFGGMTVEYLSPAFFDLVKYTFEAARRRGMKLWLYDEGGWPSGVAGGKVVAENSSFGLWVLERGDDGRIAPRQLIDLIPYPDLMNPDATDCFIRHTYEKYHQCLGEHFGRTAPGIFTDEPRLHGRVGTSTIPWSPMLPKRYLEPEIVARLFDGAPDDPATARVRREYLSDISTLIARNYYQRLRQWCEKHNLLFEGHHSGEDEFGAHGQYFGDYLQQAAHYHIPGIDIIWRQVFPGKPGGNFVALGSSSAWLAGRSVALSESFAVYGMGLTLEQMKWLAAFQIVRGVNKIGIMSSLHSAKGSRRISLATDLSPNNTIWRDIDLYVEFQRRAARFTCFGRPQARVGVYYRVELTPEDRAEAFRAEHEAVCDRIGDDLAMWMFVGFDELSKSQPHPDGARLVCGIVLSALVVHADAPLDGRERELLQQLSSTMKIIHAGSDPIELREYSPIITEGSHKGVRLLHLRDGAVTRLMFFNQNLHEVRMRFRLRENNPAALREEVLDPTRIGGLEPIARDGEWFIVHLHAGECRAFESADAMAPTPRLRVQQTLSIAGPWTLARRQQYVIADDVAIVPLDDVASAATLGDYSRIDPAFSGSLLYATTFDLPAAPSGRAVLDLGQVFYSAEVRLNGQAIGRRAWSPFEFDVTDALRAGVNALEIRVTNTPANVWMSPEIHQRDMEQYRNMYMEKAEVFMSESLHCGLVGPVTLRLLTD